jgi:NAD-dependent dihydropyrimidine dehydrogenase PreA subunit
MAKRKIIKIDEEKCNGCGQCIPNCQEGAIQIIDGKAKLVNDALCDGLGACLGHCPQGAISIEEREAQRFDENKVHAHSHGSGGCPGSKPMDLRKTKKPKAEQINAVRSESQLAQWPVQIKLVPVTAPYFENADILIAADCVPFAYANFHEDLLKEKILLVGCPKLDDIGLYKERITQILKNNRIKSVAYAHMEVPCCFGLIPVIKEAISQTGKSITFKEITISIKGEKSK